MNWSKEIAARLNQARAAAGIGQLQLADAIGVHRNTIGRIMDGRSVPDAEQLATMLGLIGITDAQLFRSDEDEAAIVHVTMYDIDVAAGPGRFLTDEAAIGTWPFPRPWVERYFGRGADLALLRVSGDSQEPELRDGDAVMIDRASRRGEGMAVVRLDDALLIKRLQSEGATVRLTSRNPNYRDVLVELGEGDRFEVIGKAVWTGKLL